jgi:hypothetical protein
MEVVMKKAIFLSVLLAVPTLAQERNLFDGKDLDGWKYVGQPGKEDGFTVADHVIHTVPGKGILVYTKEKLGNGTIHVEYKMSTDTGNSGVFIRIPEMPKVEADAINHGIEVQIDNRDNEWHRTGVLYSMTKAKASPGKGAGEWNTMDIKLDGLRTVVTVNGVLVTDYDGTSPVPEKEKSYEPDRGPRPESGYIALQHHDDTSVITFRKITFTPAKGR